MSCGGFGNTEYAGNCECVQLEHSRQPGQMPQEIKTGHEFTCRVQGHFECIELTTISERPLLMGGPIQYTKRPKVELIEYWAPDGPRDFVVHPS